MDKRTSFGRYELIRQIGMGGMADLYLAEMSGPYGFNKRVAIKKIRPDLNRHARFREMFLHESRIMAALSHRNLVQVLELGEVEGELYMCLEYVSGCDLSEIIDQQLRRGENTDPGLSAWVAREICQGLRYVHELKNPDGKLMKVIHRDINPSNILISSDGDVKLGDFGIAKSMARLVRTVQGQLMGKLGYHSPEQVRGEDLGPASDLYSVGLILYEMLALNRYIRGRSEREILSNTARPQWRPIDPERAVPQELEQIVARAVRSKPEDRYPSAEAFSQALDDFLDTLPGTVGNQNLASLVTTSESISTPDPQTDEDTAPVLGFPIELAQQVKSPKTETVALQAEPEKRRSRYLVWLMIPAAALLAGVIIWILVSGPPGPEEGASGLTKPAEHAPPAAEPRRTSMKKATKRRRRKAKKPKTPAAQALPSADELKQDLDRQLARLKERGVRPRDSAAIDRLTARARRQIGKADRQETARILAKLASEVDALVIDHQFIERKMSRLNRALDRAGKRSQFAGQIESHGSQPLSRGQLGHKPDIHAARTQVGLTARHRCRRSPDRNRRSDRCRRPGDRRRPGDPHHRRGDRHRRSGDRRHPRPDRRHLRPGRRHLRPGRRHPRRDRRRRNRPDSR
jgi:serine/threonine protein kinase